MPEGSIGATARSVIEGADTGSAAGNPRNRSRLQGMRKGPSCAWSGSRCFKEALSKSILDFQEDGQQERW